MAIVGGGRLEYRLSPEEAYRYTLLAAAEAGFGVLTANEQACAVTVQSGRAERGWDGTLSIHWVATRKGCQGNVVGAVAPGFLGPDLMSMGGMGFARGRFENAIKAAVKKAVKKKKVSAVTRAQPPASEPSTIGPQQGLGHGAPAAGAGRHVPDSMPTSIADEILKLKALLDEGIISQTEFDAGKTRLLRG